MLFRAPWRGKVLGLSIGVATAAFLGVALLALVAPFEMTQPLLRVPGQSITNLEAALICAFAVWGSAIVWLREWPRWMQWRTPLTSPWLALLAALAIASAAAPAFRANAFHMTGRLAAAFGIYQLTVSGVTTRSRLRLAIGLVVAAGVGVSLLAILEYAQVPPVLTALKAFRPGITVVGSQLRAGGSLQYPTIASMYLEIVFAFGVGLLLTAIDEARHGRAAFWFVTLLVIAEAITLTFTRAGVISIVAVLMLAGTVRLRLRGRDAGVMLVAALGVLIALIVGASRSAESMWLRFTSEGQESWYRASVEAPSELTFASGATSFVPIRVTNTGRLPWDSQGEPPFLLSYHWLQAQGDRFVGFEGVRTPFAKPVAPDAAVDMRAEVWGPRQPGRYRLEWDVVVEHRLWFSTEPGASRTMSWATVAGAPSAAPVRTTPPWRPTVRPGRLELWAAAVRMIDAHPLLGVGPDNFRLSYGAYAGLTGADPRIHTNDMYLEVLTGGGLVAGAAFVWLLWRAGECLLAGVRRVAESQGALAVAIAAAGLAIGLHALVDSFLSFGPTYVLFALTLGCAAACARGLETHADAHRI